MRINRKLNLVIPVDTENGTIYVHSVPIARDVFEKYFLVLSKTFASIYREGLQVFAGPRVAALLLRQTAENMGEWDGPDGVSAGLMSEIRRLTNVVRVGKAGWETLPYEDAISQKLLDSDDVAEVENAVCFFTCASSLHTRDQLPAILGGMVQLWGAQTTSSNCTEYAASLQTSTQEESSGATEATSSVPS